MNTQVLLFLGKAALLTIAFVLMYRLLLRRETFHGLKRGALMLSLVLSYVLPVTVITVHRDISKSPVAQTVASAQPATTPVNQIQPFSPVAQTSAPAPSVSASESATVQAPAVRKDYTAVLLRILLAAYLAGLIVMLLLRVRSILKVSAIVRGGETVERGNGYRIVVTDKNVSPFSWLGTIVVRQKDYAGIDSNVLRHEKAHIAHGHPLELMLLDFMSLFQWFNPAVWVLRRDMCLVHEQQADADVLKSVPDARPYQFMLLSQSQGGLAFNIVASFNGNGVESRIDMMNRKRSGRRQMLRFFYLPLVMCISLALTANVAYDKLWVTTKNIIIKGITHETGYKLVIKMSAGQSAGVSSGWSKTVILSPGMEDDWGDADMTYLYFKTIGVKPVVGEKVFLEMYWFDPVTGFTGQSTFDSKVCETEEEAEQEGYVKRNKITMADLKPDSHVSECDVDFSTNAPVISFDTVCLGHSNVASSEAYLEDELPEDCIGTSMALARGMGDGNAALAAQSYIIWLRNSSWEGTSITFDNNSG